MITDQATNSTGVLEGKKSIQIENPTQGYYLQENIT